MHAFSGRSLSGSNWLNVVSYLVHLVVDSLVQVVVEGCDGKI